MYLIYLIYALTLSSGLCDIQRFEDGTFIADFIVINKGQMQYPSIVMILEDLTLNECTEYCLKHLDCVTFNYNWKTRACELVDQNFDKFEALDDDPNWFNYGTPDKIDGSWSSWTSSSCSVTCGNGTLAKYRTCTAPEPKYGGTHCIGREFKTINCSTEPCSSPTCIKTEDGSCCTIPFKYAGKMYYECIQPSNKKMCIVDIDGRTAIKYCV